MSGFWLGFGYLYGLVYYLEGGKDPCQRRRSGQWDEGYGRRGDVGQWRWEEGRRIWRLMYCFCFFISLPMASLLRSVRQE